MKTVTQHHSSHNTDTDDANGTDYDEVTFECSIAPRAHSVYLVGEFNNWDTTACPMTYEKGVFRATVDLKSGDHRYMRYMFIIDGEWYSDPSPLLSNGGKEGYVPQDNSRWL